MYFIVSRLVKHQKSFLRFCGVGLVNTLIDFGLFMLLYYFSGWPLFLAHGASFSAATANSYVLNRKWTFGDAAGLHRRQFPKFVAVACGGLVLSTAVIYLLKGFVAVWLAKIFAIGAGVMWNYCGTRFLVFRAS
jgi:putative flippase GtrA